MLWGFRSSGKALAWKMDRSWSRQDNFSIPHITFHVPVFPYFLECLIPRLLRQTEFLPPHSPILPFIIPRPPLLLINPCHTTPSPHQASPITNFTRLAQIPFPNHLSLSVRNAFRNFRIRTQPDNSSFEVRPVVGDEDYVRLRRGVGFRPPGVGVWLV
jgi:hypothetical protein